MRAVSEEGTIHKKYRKGMTRVGLLYPSTYEIAMSSLVYHRLYFLLNDMENVYLERLVMPSASGGPVQLRGLEGGTPLRAFDYLVVPVHYELDYVNITRALMGSGVSLKSSERRRPKMIVGGPAPTANPEPIADMSDAIILGDLEPSLGWLESVLNEDAPLEPSRGVYVPSLGPHEVEVASASEVPPGDVRRIMAPEAAFTLAVEVARGCPFSCAFCMDSYLTKPFRPRRPEDVVSEAKSLYSRYRLRVAMIGLTINASPWFKDILRSLSKEGVEFSLPSLRAELLDEESIDLVASMGQRTVTLAPETSQRLRVALGKASRDEDFIRVAEAAGRHNMTVKLYMMVGIPGEREDDISEAAGLVKRIASLARVELSVNPLVIKPQTPLQWLPMKGEEELNRRLKLLKSLAPHASFSSYDPFLALVQASISLGDRGTLKYIAETAAEGGGRGAWRRRAAEGMLLAAVRPRRSPLPWSHVRGPVGEDALRARLEAYLREVPEAAEELRAEAA
ncbi:MAG: radical SAM protein [Acidilobus sp.]